MNGVCENCSQAIGALESPCTHRGHIVCQKCKVVLRKQAGGFTDPEANAQAGKTMARVALWAVGLLALYALFQTLAA